MITRWVDLRYFVAAMIGLGLLYLSWPQRLLLISILGLLAMLLLIGVLRYVTDAGSRSTNGGGFPSQADTDRENDHDFDILTLEQEILIRLNQARQARGIDPVALQSDLLYRARRHSLRMIKLPFFGTKDVEDGDVCDQLIAERNAVAAGAKVLRIPDDRQEPATYCLRRWMRWRRSRRILLHAGFGLSAVGIIRDSHSRTLYITCLLEGRAEARIYSGNTRHDMRL